MPSDFTSQSNELFIKFHSNYGATGSGFKISYQALYVESPCIVALCKEGEGDCDNDSHCEEALVCGQKNCANSTLHNCCAKTCNNDSDCTSGECNIEHNLCRLNSDTVDWSKCSQDSPCDHGEGDCDHHTDCQGTLLCGSENCASGPTGMDCCTDDGN